MRRLVLLLSLASTAALPMGTWARKFATSTMRYRMAAMPGKYSLFTQYAPKQTRTMATVPSMPSTPTTGYMGGLLNSLKQTWRNARAKIAAAFTFGSFATYGAYKYNERQELRQKFTVSVDTLNSNIDGLLTKSLQDKAFCNQIIDTAQRNILSVGTESLKKIAAQHPEASTLFAQELVKHIPDKAIETFYESAFLHQSKEPIPLAEINQRLQSIGLLSSKVAAREHQQLVQDIAQKLHLNPTHALRVLQYPAEYSGLVASAMNTLDMQIYGDYMMSPIVDKAKHFIPYIHIINLAGNFATESPEVQKFILGHELMHAKLGHALERIDTKSAKDMQLSREREKECDLGSAALGLEYASGGVQYFSGQQFPRFTFMDDKPDPLAAHPPIHERIGYLQDIAKQKDQ